jgi:hypothetical protein
MSQPQGGFITGNRTGYARRPIPSPVQGAHARAVHFIVNGSRSFVLDAMKLRRTENENARSGAPGANRDAPGERAKGKSEAPFDPLEIVAATVFRLYAAGKPRRVLLSVTLGFLAQPNRKRGRTEPVSRHRSLVAAVVRNVPVRTAYPSARPFGKALTNLYPQYRGEVRRKLLVAVLPTTRC